MSAKSELLVIDFYALQKEAATSRIHGSIHYRIAIDEGVIQSYKIGYL